MNHKSKLRMLNLFLEDKTRMYKHMMMLKKDKAFKTELRIYNELLVMLRDLK
ncbi:hypothetical protein IGW_03535 [Bacillus cereus ISP3191]|uniref:Uncharacterized protein n=1 Tax=Bacillus paranthracis TaxID=2026186 RepID=A0A9X8X6Y3_9BACI|nr:hypothetical protein IGW_03535 [Bacillus cereus ISP3191]SME19125.1 hypothetical protein BACERE00221_03250 [Bacillus paranthracis]